MNIKSIKSSVYRHLINIPGWRTNRKIVVIESDDWGSIRMASKDAYNYFLSKGFPVDTCPYNRYDALECNEDLEQLFEVLDSVKDANANSAILTANAVVANPDFKKIKDSGFEKYYYEPFTKTLERYPVHDRVYELYKIGIDKKLIKPQFHGREHLNVFRWMQSLQSEDKHARMAFAWRMFSLHTGINSSCRSEYLDAFCVESPAEKSALHDIIYDGLTLFTEIMGYMSISAIAPCYIWNHVAEDVLNECNVAFFQGALAQSKPNESKIGLYRKVYHYQGQRNRHGQQYLVRNAFFEPTSSDNCDDVDRCLSAIKIAFRLLKPAIISSHRVNYMGYLHPANRYKSLASLKNLLESIMKTWPDVEFMSSDQLGSLMLLPESCAE